MQMLREFKEFAMRGNVIDMAVGIIIGGAFGRLVTSLVNDVVMPPLGLLMGGVDFAEKKLILKQAVLDEATGLMSPPIAVSYGVFINTVINFMVVALAIFFVVKAMNNAARRFERQRSKGEQPTPPAPSKQELLLTEIRDQLVDLNRK